MTVPDWNPEDYPADFEDIVFSGRIVDAPIIMKIGWVTKYLHETVFPDAIKAVASGGELSGLLLGFSIVEYLAGYFAGKNTKAKDFIAFMEKYFPEQYGPYLEEIYHQLRNGLVHNLTISNPWIPSSIKFTLEQRAENHLHTKEGKVVFSIYHFIEDARRATIMYGYDMIMKPDENKALILNFNKRFNRREGASSTMVKTPD